MEIKTDLIISANKREEQNIKNGTKFNVAVECQLVLCWKKGRAGFEARSELAASFGKPLSF